MNLSNDSQVIEHLSKANGRLERERKSLRSILNDAANCIHESKQGHTPNWKRLVDKIEKYEDDYAPLGDNC